jgi:EmrB/QacA subfamily drug resistance transporter
MPFIALGVAMIIVDATIVNVAVPVIIRDLHISEVGAEWLNSIYSLVFAALLIAFGHAGDRWGRRRMFLLGTAVFVVASVVSATAVNGGVLIAGRALQGIGGAMILPATLATVNVLFTGRERAVAFAIWGSTIGVFGALGPLVGGLLTTDVSWRWAFLVNLFIGAIIVVGIARFVPETSTPSARRGVDVAGNALATLGFAGVVFALIEGGTYGWGSQSASFAVGALRWPTSWPSPIPFICALGVLSLASFVLREEGRRRRGRVVLVDLSLFAIRSFSAGLAAIFMVSLGEFGILFVLPLFLEGVLGYSALHTGVVLLAIALGTLVAGGVTPELARSVGARGVARLGLAFEVVGLVGLGVVVAPAVDVWLMVPWLAAYGIGLGMASAQLPGVILSEVPTVQSGQASGIQSTNRQVGSAFGIAVLGTIFATAIGSRTASAVRAVPGVPTDAAGRVAAVVRASGGVAIRRLATLPHGHALVEAASGAVADATRLVSLIGAAFIVVGLIGTLLLPKMSNPSGRGDVAGARPGRISPPTVPA